MRNRLTIAWIGLFLAACATTRQYEEKLEAWVGRSDSDLVVKWGAPVATFSQGNGIQLYEYQKIDRETREKSARTVAGYEPSCRTFFLIKDGKVVGWKWEGENCRSK
jgi:hypothetical protein